MNIGKIKRRITKFPHPIPISIPVKTPSRPAPIPVTTPSKKGVVQ